VLVPKDWIYQPQFPALSQEYAANVPTNPVIRESAANPAPVQQSATPWGALLLGGLAVVGVAVLTSGSKPKQRFCGACGRSGHTRTNCPYSGPRVNFSRSIPKTRRCECCGQSRYETQLHHPRGRADASDRLDLCGDCHIECGHDGHYQNPGRKPHTCRVINRPSAWRP